MALLLLLLLSTLVLQMPMSTGTDAAAKPPPLPPAAGCPEGAEVAVAVAGLLSVRLLGAAGDGVHDDLPAIQAAVECVNHVGGVVFFPPGFYWINGTLVLRERFDNGTASTGDGVVLAGSNSPSSGTTPAGRAGGSVVTGSFRPQTRLSNCGGTMTAAARPARL